VHGVVDAFSARFAGKPGWERDGSAHPAEAGALTLSSALAERSLGWRPALSLEESLGWTADWYQAHAAGKNMLDFTETQLATYQARSMRPAGSCR
jgi:CDP-glucose 4,6-dehydratase